MRCVLAAVVLGGCASFASSDGAGDADSGAPANDGGGTSDSFVPPVDDGSSADATSPCAVFKEDFETWPAPERGWNAIENTPASITISPEWSGFALTATFPVVQAGSTLRATAYRSFGQSSEACPLVIAFDVRTSTTSDSSKLTLLRVQGSSGGRVELVHQGSFWYLHVGNNQSQITMPTGSEVGRASIAIAAVGAHAKADFSLNGGAAISLEDLSAVVGNKADVLLGAELQGSSTGGTTAYLDALQVSW